MCQPGEIDGSGALISGDSLKLDAGRNLAVASTTVGGSSQDGPSSHSYTDLDRVAGLYVTGSGATVLQATAGQGIQLTAAQVAHAGGPCRRCRQHHAAAGRG
ncbi:hypothetical protein [Amphibiibacter pelophylacis]|uniref:Uncharacterized protein n=1 Tax=Amphibiibacter pelophylacis TaxID=1799477 RepID=A0ACC6P427_9BURK